MGPARFAKTTMIGALVGSVPPRERVITCEEVFELRLAHRDVVSLQRRQPSLEGTGEIALRRLVKEALRMRRDRLVIGEPVEAEALDLTFALNVGIPGHARCKRIRPSSACEVLAEV